MRKKNWIIRLNVHNIFLLLLTISVVFGNRLPGITIPGIGFLFPIRIITIVYPLHLLRTNRALDVDSFRKQPRYVYSLLMVVLFLFIGSAPVLWTNSISEFLSGFLMYYTQFMTLIIGLAEIRDKKDVDFVLKMMLLCSIIIGSIGLYESFSGNSVFEVTYDYYLSTYNSIGLMRPRSIFYNTNNYAFYFSLVLCLLWSKYKNNRFASILLFVFCGLNVFLTGSRLSLLVLLVIIAIDFLFYSEGKKKLGYLVIACIVVIAVGEQIFGSELFTNHIEIADEDRLPIWRATIAAIHKTFWMGGGFGSAVTLSGGSPHNLALEWILDCGIIPVIIFIIWLLWITTGFIRDKYKFGVMFCIAFALSTIGPSSLQGYYFIWFGFALMIKDSCFVTRKNTKFRKKL
ncbi:MAG: O-antigen ligase family protein [Suipraeoptans sp.]